LVAAVLERLMIIAGAVFSKPLVYLPLIGVWLVTGIYFIVNHDEKHGHSYVMSTGLAHVFTAFMISPFAKSDLAWSFSDIRTVVVLILFAYGIFLTVLGIIKAFPDLLAEFFGDPGHALVPSMMAVLYVEDTVPFDWTTFMILVVPVVIVSAVKVVRRFSGR
jgi:hypothetical protein